jgi:PKD repeat protein
MDWGAVTVPRWGVLVAIVGTFVALGALAPTAGAAIKLLPNGKAFGYQPLAGTMSQHTFDGTFSNLDYNGGPVMPSNTDYLIFWKPSTASDYPSDYKSGLVQYFTDLAHDSGGHQNVDSAAAQYNDASGNVAAYNVTFGGSFDDTDTYPTGQCESGTVSSGVVCLTDSQLQAELESFVTAHGLPHDTSHEYYLIFPPGVQNCLDSTKADGCSLGTTAGSRYCSDHGATTSSPSPTAIIYINQPYVTDTTPNTNNGCDVANDHPNGTSDGALIGGLSHEHNESTTDPFPNTAWTDWTNGASTGFENGDKCSAGVKGFSGSFGPAVGTAPDGSPYNQLINGHEYLYQQEWSNQGNTCVQRFTFSGAAPTAQFSSAPGSGLTMNFDATGSTAPGGVAEYHWMFETPTNSVHPNTDTSVPTTSNTYGSSGQHTVSLTVYAPDGTSIGASRVITTGVAGATAAFTLNPTQTVTGAAATLTSSSTAAGGDAISQQTWNFGDGTAGSGASVSHAYAATGTYPVTLLVTTTLGQTTSTTKQLVVTPPPVAAFTASATTVPAGTPVSFDGSGSNEPGGSIAGYSWNFGDGGSATGATTSHTYAHRGIYTVTLAAADPFGNAAQATHQVVVLGTPSALITAPGTAIAGKPVAFSGTGSTDIGSTLTSYDWKFGDGGVGSGATLNHTYAHPGSYTASLTVTDAGGSSSTNTKTVVVTAPVATIASVVVHKSKTVEKLTLKVTGPGTLSVGKLKFKITKAGAFVFKLKLSKAQRNQLRHHHTLKFRLTFKFKPTVGTSSSRTVSFKIKG